VKPTIVILGAGVLGSSVAWHLTRRGVTGITVVDRAPRLGGGSTALATGGFRAQFDDEVEIRLSLLSREKLRDFEKETGHDSGYDPRGYLFLARTAEELETLRAAQAIQHALGLTEARMLTAAEARALNPVVSDELLVGAAFCPTDGFIRPMSILEAYAAGAQQGGARFEFEVAFSDWRIENNRAIAAITSAGEFRADRFVIALGAWSGAPIVPLRRHVLATEATSLVPPEAPMTIWAGDWFHLRARDGRVLLLWPDEPPLVDDEHWATRVQEMTAQRAAPLAKLAIAERWSGFYEMTPDGRPLVGRHPELENVYYAAGGCGHGVMHAPAIGHLLTELMLDGETSIDIRKLDPGRFGGSSY
jgi:sarcosine oxidase, subunit beta